MSTQGSSETRCGLVNGVSAPTHQCAAFTPNAIPPKWRRDGDSNPGEPCGPSGFQVRQPAFAATRQRSSRSPILRVSCANNRHVGLASAQVAVNVAVSLKGVDPM